MKWNMLLAAIVLLAVGIVVPKFAIRDTVLPGADYSCVRGILERPLTLRSLDRFSILWFVLRTTGTAQVTRAEPSVGEVKLYAPFGIYSGVTASRECLRATEPGQSIEPAVPIDGEYGLFGVYRASPVVGGMKSFASDEPGISLQYPNGYLLFESESEASSLDDVRGITIAPEEPALRIIAQMRANAQVDGEGPPSIHFAFYRLADSAMSLEEWLHTDMRANFYLPLPPWEDRENTLTAITVAGQPAYAYSNNGLYTFDYVAFKYGEWIVLASSARSNDNIPNPDFPAMLSSIRLSGN